MTLTDAELRDGLPARLAALQEAYGRIEVVTSKPVALDSPDHLKPHGTMRDNSFNRAFNAKLRGLGLPPPLRVLDIGCAGGAMVRTFIEEWDFAVGIEGSDYSLKEQRAEWATIPGFLFTADVTEWFSVTYEMGPHPMLRRRFDFTVVTAWEIIEHIAEERLPAMFKSIGLHLHPRGLVIASISPNEEIIDGVALHQTVKPREWWIDKLDALGWVNQPELVEYFGVDVVRGPERHAPGSFVVVLKRKE